MADIPVNEQPKRRARTKRIMPRSLLQPNRQRLHPQPSHVSDSTSQGSTAYPQPTLRLRGGARTKTARGRNKHLYFSKAYWDSLPNIYLTHRALVEFRYRESRLSGPLRHRQRAPVPAETLCRNVEEFARRGGPDLTHLINYPYGIIWESYNPPKANNASLYDLNAQNHLNRHGVEERLLSANWPRNFNSLKKVMRKQRTDVHNITDQTRVEFIDLCKKYKSKHKLLENIYRILFGERGINLLGAKTAKKRRFANFAPLVPHMTTAKPDVADGASPEILVQQMMDELEAFIIPFVSRGNSSNSEGEEEAILAAPNFFLYNMLGKDDRSAGSRAALHCGSLGARAMHEIQCYGKEKTYDQEAYSFVAVLLRTHMTIYAVHPIQSQVVGREKDYQMTQIYVFRFDEDLGIFADGIQAFRNLREHARFWRDLFLVGTGDDENGASGASAGNSNSNQGTSEGNGSGYTDNKGGSGGISGEISGGSNGDNSKGQDPSSSSSNKRREESDPHEAESHPPKRPKRVL